MLFGTFEVGRSKFGVDDKLALDAYSRMKDVLLYVLGFLGTVTGYYLGRIPAEKQADKALQSAAVAQNQASQSHKEAAVLAGNALKAQEREAQTKATVRSGLETIRARLHEDSLGGPPAHRADGDIESLLNWLSQQS